MKAVTIRNLHSWLLSESAKEKTEGAIIWISIISFVIHLALIALVNFGYLELPFESKLLRNPISAIYTPFSFLLLFEVYLLVFHIPNSTSVYIAKQYEIITLILIRRIFKDLANLDLSTNWFEIEYDLQFTYDLITTVLLFGLIYLFHRINQRPNETKPVHELSVRVQKFIRRKKGIASILVPVVIGMAIYSFSTWIFDSVELIQSNKPMTSDFSDINNIFFDEFFTLLILTDVLLLLFSTFHTTSFHVFIRNSGFIISTILIRISFSTEGLVNNILILVAVLFGVIILWLTKQYSSLSNKNLQV